MLSRTLLRSETTDASEHELIIPRQIRRLQLRAGNELPVRFSLTPGIVIDSPVDAITLESGHWFETGYMRNDGSRVYFASEQVGARIEVQAWLASVLSLPSLNTGFSLGFES